MEGVFSDMLPESSYLEAPTIVEDSNETTIENEMGALKPIAVDENNSNRLHWNPTTFLVPMSWKKRKNGFTNGLTTMMCGIMIPIHLQKVLK